jgi:2',3'-cyclic-nucleotide 2'-phosphodiesterase (5'-nucleotidase family)
MVIGSNDWNFGLDRLLALERVSGMPILCGNVVHRDTGEPVFEHESLIFEVQGLWVGVFGIIDPELYNETAPNLLEGIVYQDPVQCAQRLTAKLRAQGCDIVVCITPSAVVERAIRVAGMDLVLTGPAEAPETLITETPRIIRGGYLLQSVHQVDIRFETDTRTIISIEDTILPAEDLVNVVPDPRTETALSAFQDALEPILEEVIGQTPVFLDADVRTIRIQDTNLTRLISDAYRTTTGADIAFVNSSVIRQSIPAGTITNSDVIDLLPYGNYLVTLQVRGQGILETLEHSASIFLQARASAAAQSSGLWPVNSGRGLHVSGLTFKCSVDNPAGAQVWDVRVGPDQLPLDPDAMYTVAVSNYVQSLPDYPYLNEAVEIQTWPACIEVLRQYIITTGVEPSLEGERMTFE